MDNQMENSILLLEKLYEECTDSTTENHLLALKMIKATYNLADIQVIKKLIEIDLKINGDNKYYDAMDSVFGILLEIMPLKNLEYYIKEIDNYEHENSNEIFGKIKEYVTKIRVMWKH